MNEQALNLKDIHLPEPILWWPLAPGWWMVIALLFVAVGLLVIAKKIYQSKQLKRDIAAELEIIKQQFSQTQNKRVLAKSLSILLRRVCISYQTTQNVAGLTGDDWLLWLDNEQVSSTTRNTAKSLKFQSETGKALLKAPYLPENSELDFDAKHLIRLCESWLLASHKNSPTEKS